MTTILIAPAKLTLGLRITGVRDDGFHLIEAEMATLNLADRLFVSPGQGLSVNGTTEGFSVDSDDNNLVNKALALVGRQAQIRIEKNIPAGAGLGGGSANAAAVLRWAGFTDLEAAATLGADVAFCLRGGRAWVTGIGQEVSLLPFEPRTFTLLTPPFGCSTPAVYGRWDAMGGPRGQGDNDLEPAALTQYPELTTYRDALEEASGLTPHLAGSGSTWFVEGAFPGENRRVVHTVAAE